MKLQKLGGWTAIGLIFVGILSSVFLARIRPEIGPTDFAAISLDPIKMSTAYAASPFTFNVLLLLSMFRGIGALLIALVLQDRMQKEHLFSCDYPLLPQQSCQPYSPQWQ